MRHDRLSASSKTRLAAVLAPAMLIALTACKAPVADDSPRPEKENVFSQQARQSRGQDYFGRSEPDPIGERRPFPTQQPIGSEQAGQAGQSAPPGTGIEGRSEAGQSVRTEIPPDSREDFDQTPNLRDPHSSAGQPGQVPGTTSSSLGGTGANSFGTKGRTLPVNDK